ncbi:PadR family transcriptional regulator [Cohnella faecalis]|uniref:PadR family transcriptional regulator n=1 Tax=Cohnella faecalis TaxID=2315694 RepID=A0A398CQ36_9BACL|nr:PadR family transcriptional regulator [Cohnella faecalis]RIE04562.1 PadR family transcriptional regulator [Cohnella faecalis]
MVGADVILGLLHKRPFSGYEIKNYFETLFFYFYGTSFGTIYPTLNKLERQGCISKQSVPQDNRPNKNLYSLTDKGREQFRDYMDSPVEADVFRSDFMMRLFFGSLAGPEKILGWMTERLEQTTQTLKKMEEDYNLWSPSMSPSQQICMQWGIESQRTSIHSLRDGIDRLQTTTFSREGVE